MTETASERDEATILLVDDNAQNLKVLYETLKDRGYRLLIANEGEKALALAERHQPEVILLDIMMPGMDGYDVCQRLKENPDTADGAVVFLSALDDVDAKVKGFSLGGADYISKPFQAQEVIARVATHARVIQLERQLQARNRQLESDQTRILNAISEGIYGLTTEGEIIFANPAAGAMLGLEPEELVGQNFFRLHFGTQDADSDDLPVLATCRNGVAEHQRDVAMYRPDGTSFPVEYRSSPKLEDDQVLGAVVVFRDISAELENERALDEARETVDIQRDQLAHASRLSTMGEMAAGFAHEVNQPLTAISNYVRVSDRLLSADELDRELLGQTLHKIEAQAHRASEVIRRIRSFVKKPASGKEVIQLDCLLEETRQFAEVDARTNQVAVELDVDDSVPAVLADPIQVQQVALNLIRNALEATRSAGGEEPVRVTAAIIDGQFVRVEVTDRGVGLPEDAEEKLFHPFFTTKQEGMGIGLALCRSLIQAQNGEIGFERPEEGGAKFYFTLPVAPVTAEQPEEAVD
ncbi:hybrid sensor histidine kinase/response regulator [Marinobacter sp. R17]|uniref:ATP-binding response regulator n=1 Tax=Marinobacter sp. R17 TaxID=2484250 RepID=UPI000F4C64E1|nr:response regulator [Marinobacter sp. R17]ROU00405.1 hybrid sensor histidine kinase/response regulator [Marinobacter sp. R17]